MSLGVDFSINDSIEQVVSYQQERRIRNIGSVAYRAAELLEGVEDVPNEEVDHDWSARFFNEVQDVSSEEMQELWAKVLAGQVERPGSTSVKTLDILRNMDKGTASLFQRLHSVSTAIVVPPSQIIDSRAISLGKNAGANSLQDYGLSFDQLNLLNEHGLIIADYHSWFPYNICITREGRVVLSFRHQSEFWALHPLENFSTNELKINGVAMTAAGMELSHAVGVIPMPVYTEALKDYFKSLNLAMLPVAR